MTAVIFTSVEASAAFADRAETITLRGKDHKF